MTDPRPRPRSAAFAGVPLPRWPVVAVLAACLLAAAVGPPLAGEDGAGELAESAWDFAGGLGWAPWVIVPAVGVLSALHYLCAAITLRAAAGVRLRLPEVVSAQLAAAAASRIVPAGLGGLTVNSRYLACRGLAAAQAVASVTVVKLAGFVTHLGLWTLAVALGASALPVKVPKYALPLLAAAGAVIAMVALGWALCRRRRPGTVRRIWSDAARAVVGLRGRRRDLLILFAGSAGTPVVLGTAFAISVAATTGTPSPGRMVTLLAVYLFGTAAGNAVPLPAGTGSSEAALIAALVAVGLPVAGAAQSVVIFRAVTFWAPVPFGILAARRLRKAGAL